MSKGSNKKLKLKLTDNKCLQKLNEKKNCGKDNESFILNKDLDDPNWKFSHILSKPGPSNIIHDRDEILNISKESLYERVKKRTRNVVSKYVDSSCVEEPVKKNIDNSVNISKKKKTENLISNKGDNKNIKRTYKQAKNEEPEEIQNETVIKNKRECKKRSLSVCNNVKTIKNDFQSSDEVNAKKKNVIKKVTKKQTLKNKAKNDSPSQVTSTNNNKIQENDREDSILQEQQYIDINVENIISGKRKRKAVHTYDINVLTTYNDVAKKETVAKKKANQGQKKFYCYIDSLLKKNIIDSKVAEEFKKLCIKNIKIPKQQGYFNDCVVKEDEKGGIPPCVVCNEISDVVLRCRWCKDAYHWVCYPIRLFKYTFPKRPWRCINCHLKNVTKKEISDIKKILRIEKSLIKKTECTKKLNFFDKLNNNINIYLKLQKRNGNAKMKYYNLFVNVIDKSPCDFDDESFSDSSDDEEWYRNSLYPNGLNGSLKNCCFLCLKPETETKHIMKCSFCRGQYHCDCLTPPFCYAPLDDFNCGYHINESKKEPNLLSYNRVLDSIDKFNNKGFKNNTEFELEFKNAIKQIEREEGSKPIKRPSNFCRNVPTEVERYYTSQFAKLSQYFDSQDNNFRNNLKKKLENDIYDIFNQYTQLCKWGIIEEDINDESLKNLNDNEMKEDNKELNKQFTITNIFLKYLLKVPLKAFIISKSFSIRYFFYNQLFLGDKDSKLDVKINEFPYNSCFEIKNRRYPVFVNGILIGKDRFSLTPNDNCKCQQYFRLKNVGKAFVPSVVLKSGDIIRIGCCVILFGHA
uniref:PHD-type domain-containing protein n=1 Tax=Strongyloides stercoralis TaxID=6248 RepID=A0A0K0E5G0_STRER